MQVSFSNLSSFINSNINKATFSKAGFLKSINFKGGLKKDCFEISNNNSEPIEHKYTCETKTYPDGRKEYRKMENGELVAIQKISPDGKRIKIAKPAVGEGAIYTEGTPGYGKFHEKRYDKDGNLVGERVGEGFDIQEFDENGNEVNSKERGIAGIYTFLSK